MIGLMPHKTGKANYLAETFRKKRKTEERPYGRKIPCKGDFETTKSKDTESNDAAVGL